MQESSNIFLIAQRDFLYRFPIRWVAIISVESIYQSTDNFNSADLEILVFKYSIVLRISQVSKLKGSKFPSFLKLIRITAGDIIQETRAKSPVLSGNYPGMLEFLSLKNFRYEL